MSLTLSTHHARWSVTEQSAQVVQENGGRTAEKSFGWALEALFLMAGPMQGLVSPDFLGAAAVEKPIVCSTGGRRIIDALSIERLCGSVDVKNPGYSATQVLDFRGKAHGTATD
jgi:hypothetical protein